MESNHYTLALSDPLQQFLLKQAVDRNLESYDSVTVATYTT